MEDVIKETDKLIDTLKSTEFVKRMLIDKELIIKNKLINTSDVKILYENEIIHDYVENQNILDFHIYYLNKEINKLINNKVCRSNNESN